MSLPHYPGHGITPDKDFIYLGDDTNAKPYVWYYGANALMLKKYSIYKVGISEHTSHGYTVEKYYKYENIEISGKIVNVNSIFDSLIKKELLIPVAAFRNKRIDEILED